MWHETEIVIANGATTSGHCAIADASMVTVQLPATFTGATFSYETTNDVDANGEPENFSAALDYTGTAIGNITAVDGGVIPLDPRVAQCRFFRIVSVGAEGQEDIIKVFLKG
jgi:hypothetical protein